MEKKKIKYFYYVAIATEDGARFITEIDKQTKTAFWNKNEKPIELNKTYAEDIAFRLNLNFTPAFVITSYYKIEQQIFIAEENDERK